MDLKNDPDTQKGFGGSFKYTRPTLVCTRYIEDKFFFKNEQFSQLYYKSSWQKG
jgi:hypothetical protein